jgi:hypothetical protein
MYVHDRLRRRDRRLILYHRLCELFACYVRSLFGIVDSTSDYPHTSRLNSRDHSLSRDHTTISHSVDTPNSAFKLSSIRVNQGVSVSMHHQTTSQFGRSKSGHDEGPTFEIPKSVRYLFAPTRHSQTDTYLISRMQIASSLFIAKVKHPN